MADPGSTRAGHPDEILTAAYLDGVLAAPLRDEIEAHLASCDRCRSGIALLKASAREPSSPPPDEILDRARALAARPEDEEPWTSKAVSALAAAVVVGAGLALWFTGTTFPSGRPLSAYRAAAPAAIRALSPGPNARPSGSDLVFEWTEVAGADRYLVVVAGLDGLPVASFEAPAGSARAAWPPGVPLRRPGAFVWKVRAMALDRVIAESPPVRFEIR
jgi:anti-sigma factor RsiW